MTRPPKFVVLAIVAAVWAAALGFAPRVTSASPSSNEARHACVHLDATAFNQAAYACAAASRSNPVESDGFCFEEDGPDDACCKASSTFPVAEPSHSIGDYRDRADVRSDRESLAARGPPQR